MAASTEPNLELKHSWAVAESYKPDMDANLKMLGAVVHLSVINLTTSAQPGSPTEGARYMVPSGHTWPAPATSQQIAVYANGAWKYYTPKLGWILHNEADGTLYRYTGSAWAAVAPTIGTGTVTSAMILDGTIVDADINAAAAISWTKISKTGSSLADLTTRSASDLSSGTLPLARLSGITNTEIAAGAAIALSKLAALTASRALVSDGSGVVSVSSVTAAELGHLSGVSSAIQTQLNAKASLALDNLASVAIASPLLPATAAGVDFGSATKPWKDIWLAGSSGTPASNNFRVTGTATGARVVTLPDATITVAGSASALTSTRVPYATTGGLLTDSAGFKFTVVSNSLSVGDGTGAAGFVLNGLVSSSPSLQWQQAGTVRWLFYTTGGETGSDAGSDLVFGRAYTDAGVGIDNPITIARAAGGVITVVRPISSSATITTNSLITGGSLKATGLTANRIPFLTTAGLLTDSSALTYISNSISNTKASTYSSESSAGLALVSAASDSKLLLGADAANDLAYVQAMQDGTSYATRPLCLQPMGGLVIVNGITSNGARFQVYTGAAATVGLTVGGAASQSADYLNVNSSSGSGGDVLKLAASGAITATLLDATTNALSTAHTIQHNSSGTPAAGFGTRQLFNLHSSTTTNQNAGSVDVYWSTATHASRTSVIAFCAVNNAAALAEILTIRGDGLFTPMDGSTINTGTTNGLKIGTATSQKIGFFNSTPIVQPSGTGTTTGFTAGAGSAVLSDSTFTGNVGSKAYTIGDVVAHLKNLGLIAAS